MDLSDALMVTGLGMAVVFTGLLLTSLLIVSFNLLPRILDARRPSGAVDEEAPVRATTAPTDDAVLAVITAVLEVERRLYRSEAGGRLTIDR